MATLTRLLELLHMRRSARAGAAAQSANPSAESASSRPAILSMCMRWKGVVAGHIRRVGGAVNLAGARKALSDWRVGVHRIVTIASAHRHAGAKRPSPPIVRVADVHILLSTRGARGVARN